MTPIFEVRPLTLADAAAAAARLATSPQDCPVRFRPDGLFRPELARATYEACAAGARAEWVWVVDVARDGVVGAISFVPAEGELEWWIAAAFRRLGLAGAALSRLAPLLAAEFAPLIAHVDTDNAASRRTAERAGFQVAGLVLQDGRQMLRYERRAEARAA